jgi:uncharacterized protein
LVLRSVACSFGVLGALFCAAAAPADFATAYRVYERGDYVTAFDYFTETARRGHAAAQVSLGWMYSQGLGVPRDERQALYWYGQAAHQGDRDAQAILDIRRLGNIPEGQQAAADRVVEDTGKLTTREHLDRRSHQGGDQAAWPLEESQSAIYWHRKFAEAGHREAQLVLGVRYELGQGVAKDVLRATYWYRKAAEQGSALGQFNLGLKYAIGEGVPLDPSAAWYWYQRAAAQGHLESQFLVGVAYAQGNGVAPAPAQAVRWLRAAAERGYAPAQYHLGSLYVKGEGIARDWSQAYLWLSLAAAQGHDGARLSRDEAGLHLGPAERLRVQQLARRGASLGKLIPTETSNDSNRPAAVSPAHSLLGEGQSPASS